jgi:hypothetical protein
MKFKNIKAEVGDVVAIKSDEFYVWVLDETRNDGSGYWREMSLDEILQLSLDQP